MAKLVLTAKVMGKNADGVAGVTLAVAVVDAPLTWIPMEAGWTVLSGECPRSIKIIEIGADDRGLRQDCWTRNRDDA